MHGSTLGSGYDRWLTTPPEDQWTYEEFALKCGTCGRFVSRKVLLREEPWEDGWQCDGKLHKAPFDYCDDIYNDARQCWQEGWTTEEITEHNATHHKHYENEYTKCSGVVEHAPHYVVETSGVNRYYACSAGHEAKEVLM